MVFTLILRLTDTYSLLIAWQDYIATRYYSAIVPENNLGSNKLVVANL